MAERHRSKSRGLPLTVRLLAALLVGSLFLGVVVTKLASRQELAALGRDQEARMEKLAASLAARTAPLLQTRDDLRLAILCASVAELGARRVLVLDRAGLVVLDTGVALGGQSLQVRTTTGGFSRDIQDGTREWLAPAVGLRGLVGEVRLRYPEIRSAAAPFSWGLFFCTGLSCLTLVLLAGFVSHGWMLRVREAAETVNRLARGETSVRFRRSAGGAILDLQESLHGLGKSLREGDNQARGSLVELAQQTVELLERHRVRGHAERTCRYAMILAQRLGQTPEEIRDLEHAARLHDLGDAWMRPSLLDKDGPLDESDRACLKGLPDRGASLLGRLPSLRRVADIIRHHREKFDGTGYPDGARGDRIPLGARILAIAEAYDQLTTCFQRGRPQSWPEALDTLQDERGERFDPWLLDLFEEEIRKAPVPEPQNQVLISASGILHYKAVEEGWLIDPIPEGEDEDLSAWWETELEVVDPIVGDTIVGDTVGGDPVEEDRG